MSTTPPGKQVDAVHDDTGSAQAKSLTVAAAPAATAPSPGASMMPPPRDYEVGIQEEFNLAEKSDTAESWTLFIDRHPGHPLLERAKQRLAAAKARPAP